MLNVFYYEMQYRHSAGSVLRLWLYFLISVYHLEEQVKQKLSGSGMTCWCSVPNRAR